MSDCERLLSQPMWSPNHRGHRTTQPPHVNVNLLLRLWGLQQHLLIPRSSLRQLLQQEWTTDAGSQACLQ
jgi:hypothetical protein